MRQIEGDLRQLGSAALGSVRVYIERISVCMCICVCVWVWYVVYVYLCMCFLRVPFLLGLRDTGKLLVARQSGIGS